MVSVTVQTGVVSVDRQGRQVVVTVQQVTGRGSPAVVVALDAVAADVLAEALRRFAADARKAPR